MITEKVKLLQDAFMNVNIYMQLKHMLMIQSVVSLKIT